MLETDGSSLPCGSWRDGHHPLLLLKLMSLLANSSGRTAPLSPVQRVLVRQDGELELSLLTVRKPLSWLPNGFQSYQNNTICRHFSWLKRAAWRGKGVLCGPREKCFAAGHCTEMLTECPLSCVTHRCGSQWKRHSTEMKSTSHRRVYL